MVTGGAGFIGFNLIRYFLGRLDFAGRIVNYDKLTYAGNRLNLLDIDDRDGGKQYSLEHGDICDRENVKGVLIKYQPGTIVHFAAESHVDRSILWIFSKRTLLAHLISSRRRASFEIRETTYGSTTSALMRFTGLVRKLGSSLNQPRMTRIVLTPRRKRPGTSGKGLLSYLRVSCDHFQLFKQLRPLSFP